MVIGHALAPSWARGGYTILDSEKVVGVVERIDGIDDALDAGGTKKLECSGIDDRGESWFTKWGSGPTACMTRTFLVYDAVEERFLELQGFIASTSSRTILVQQLRVVEEPAWWPPDD